MLENWAISLITGVIVFFITWPINIWLTKKGTKKEYYENVNKANESCLEILKEYILTFNLFDDKTVESVIYGQGLKCKVNIKDMYNIKQIKSILISDFITMRFIQDIQRKEILDMLNATKEEDLNKAEIIINKEGESKRIIKLMTLSISMIVTMLTIFTMLIVLNRTNSNIEIIEKEMFLILIPMIITVELIYILALTLKRVKKNNKSEKEKDIKSSQKNETEIEKE